MRIRFLILFCLAAADVCLADGAPDFSRDIRPILSGKCFKCHGPDAGSREADLRLDQREAAIEWGVITPGSASESSLMDRITTDDPDLRMPPNGPQLTTDEIDSLKSWINAGADYTKHWAYVPPRAVEPPPIPDQTWNQRNAIDFFIQAALVDQNLEPSPVAEPAVLLRRLSLDLIGLPPTFDEVAAFEEDPSEQNFEANVDRLLDSVHFGEKWAQHWLDLARYADSNGYQHDDLRTMWPYRDWVINALNADMPFDQFTIEQLAGDLLPEPSREQLIATGFHRNVATNFSGGSKVDEVRADILHDRVSTTGQVWLGMTMECCQCHDHKFDPISQVEYYQLYAYFNQAIPELDIEGPGMFKKKFIGAEIAVYASPEEEAQAEQILKQIELEQAALQRAKPRAREGQAAWEQEFQDSDRASSIPWERFPWNLRGGAFKLKIPREQRSAEDIVSIEALLFYDHPSTGPYEKALDLLKSELAKLAPRSMIMRDSTNRVPTNLFNRGDYTSLGERVEAGTPGVLHELDSQFPSNRLGLAKWLVNPNNPLTARVTVNRIWAEIFGQGIVTTLEDFGMQSAPPTHPELLDWLSVQFVDNGWSMKRLIKTIVMSSTYRQTSAAPHAKINQDSANQWLSRGPRFRLSAELVRDNLLAISGKLSTKVGGPSVYPPQPAGMWKQISGANVSVYPTSVGEDRYRRGLYTFLRRGNPNPMVLNFDGSNRSSCVTKRDRSNTPVQALNLLNDPSFVEAAEAFAAWMSESPGEEGDKVTAAFRKALARAPTDQEVQALLGLYRKHNSWFLIAQAILNLDETITKS